MTTSCLGETGTSLVCAKQRQKSDNQRREADTGIHTILLPVFRSLVSVVAEYGNPDQTHQVSFCRQRSLYCNASCDLTRHEAKLRTGPTSLARANGDGLPFQCLFLSLLE